MGMHMWHCLFHMLSGPGKNIEFMRRTKVLIPLPPLSVTIELKKKKLKLLRRVMEKWLWFCYMSSSNGRLPIKLEQEAQNIVNNSVSIRLFCYC